MSTVTKQVISNSGIENITDHYAYMWIQLQSGVVNATPADGEEAYRHITIDNNAWAEGDLASSCKTLDINGIVQSTMASTVFSTVVRAHDTHIQNVVGGSANLNTLLTNSGINVNSKYEEVYYYVNGRHLSANNVFDQYIHVMATATIVGSGTGCTFTDGVALGTGTGNAGVGNYCASQLKCVVISGLTADVDMKIYATQEDGTETTIDVTVTTLDSEVNIGTTADTFIDVTNIQTTGGDATDEIDIVNIPERTPAF